MPCLRSGLFVAACLATAQVLALDAPPRTQDPLTEVPLNPALVAYARNHGIPLHGIDLPAGRTLPAREGDEVILLLSLQQPNGFNQWIARLRYEHPNAAKGEDKALPADTIFTSTGLELHYPNSPAALSLDWIGPFAANSNNGKKPETVSVTNARAIVSAESLQHGMAGYGRSALQIRERLRAAGIERPKYSGSSAKPSEKEAIAGRAEAAAFQLTPEEERLSFSVVFSLRSFFVAASNIPACEDLIEQVIQKPSVWSFATNLGLSANFEYGWQEVESVPAARAGVKSPAYLIPVRVYVNDKPTVRASFIATTPQPPLETSAGILAICAEHPTDDTKRLFIRVIAARRAAPAAAGR